MVLKKVDEDEFVGSPVSGDKGWVVDFSVCVGSTEPALYALSLLSAIILQVCNHIFNLCNHVCCNVFAVLTFFRKPETLNSNSWIPLTSLARQR